MSGRTVAADLMVGDRITPSAHNRSPEPEDAFLGTTGPRAGRLEKFQARQACVPRLNENRPAVNPGATYVVDGDR